MNADELDALLDALPEPAAPPAPRPRHERLCEDSGVDAAPADGAAWSTNTTFSVCLGDESAHNRAVVLLGTGRARVDRRTPGNKSVNCG